jgi:CDP-glycerol glycerophosphotransferase
VIKMGFKSKLRNFKDCAINSMIYNAYYNDDLDEKLVYLESRDGLDFTGNIFRIVEELSNDAYDDLKLYVHAKPHVVDKIKAYQKNYNLKIDKIITKEATATKILEKAKYIFTDSGIRPKYVKREGQIFVNTWHGTPLKLMGKYNIAEEHRLGNVQHPLLSSDYLLYPNDYMMDKMLDSYMIEKIYPGKILLEGYPRNSAFFRDSDDLKNVLNLNGKEIFVYMPTFRGILMDRDNEGQKNDVENYLSEIDANLNDNQILFAKLHVLNESEIDFSRFDHIKSFPQGYEIYDIVNLADVLITDYSSVFFDFANTRRKIILFNYDEEDYLSYRGFYFPLSDLPFPKVQTIDELIRELNSPKNYDDASFLEKFCTYDNPDAVKKICKHIFSDENVCNEKSIENDNPNILIFAGALYKFGIASSLFNLLNNLDRDNYNFFITFKQWEENILENHEEIFQSIPENVEVLPIRFNLTPTIREKLDYNKFYLSDDKMDCPESLHKLFNRSFEKQFGAVKFDAVIDFDGYNHDETLMFVNSARNSTVWVHNDMIQEIETKGNQNPNILKEAYSNANHVAVVSPSLIDPTSKISGCRDNISVVHNLNDYIKIKENSTKEISLNENTVVYNNDIFDVLNKDGFKFITLGRFSPEKGHIRLIKAFDRFCEEFPDSQLIIIGGYGVLFDETCRLLENIEHGKNVTLINNISNPMPILKQCDLFILSSFYEGWPMVIMEADTLDVPIISTDIESTRQMGEYGGYLVENSLEGLLSGMYDFAEGKVKPLESDYEQYNRNAITEFFEILK